MTATWSELGWAGLPGMLVLAWFVLLIGGFSSGGLVHLLLLAAIGLFGYQAVTGRSA